MLKSMTGFGRSEYIDAKRKITVEIKAVNHRYLDCSIKMPKKLGFFEASIRTLLKDYIQRGKVDVFITYEDYTEDNFNLKYNKDMAKAYLTYLNEMAEEFGIENDVRVSTLSRYPEVFSLEEANVDEDEIWSDLDKVIREAASAFVESRIKEGENLKSDLTDKLDTMLTYVDEIESRAPEIIEEYRKNLLDKVSDLLADSSIDESRILGEVTLYADKICVDEEIVRLRSHITTTKDILAAGGSVGRKLDFIAQEMNREANTILSKANDLATSDIAINLKTDIEKVREQIQNIE
ncbi:MAG: YicC family protein [Lachnospiraceae bacterium]|nr:YicC family protein [Lachnospiraceae bacterium]